MARTTTVVLAVAAMVVTIGAPTAPDATGRAVAPMALTATDSTDSTDAADRPHSPTAVVPPAAVDPPDNRFYHPPDTPFWSRVWRVDQHPVRHRMRGVSWHKGCPVPLRALRYMRLRFVRFDGSVHVGALVVHRSAVRVVRRAMRRLHTIGYPIRRIRPVHHYDGDDNRSMSANNTSAFNCRRVAGTDTWSRHAFGTAIDVNPRRNPWVSSTGTVLPANGASFADRSDRRPGMLYRRLRDVRAFTTRGWGWGGDWDTTKDWQHFSDDGH